MTLPFISSRPSVIKIGGSIMEDESALAGLCLALVGLHAAGLRFVLVHGGGKDINKHLGWLQEKPVFQQGLRVTSIAALKIVEMTLSGYVNKKLVSLLNADGGVAVGLSGVDGTTFLCEQISAELGQVGHIVKVRTGLVDTLLSAGFIPVVSPISVDKTQAHFNVNADDAAAALAVAMQAEKLIFVSDIEGVQGQDGLRIPELDGESTQLLIRDGVATGGMIPKLNSCRAAIASGVAQVHICGWSGTDRFAAQVRGDVNTGTIIR
jgi:acetylglutamate kinase